jgi:hypothetical protein
MKIALKIGLLIVIIVLGYMVVESIMEPVRFNEQKDIRSALVIEKLEDIRAAQLAYKTFNGKYMASWDTLIDFVKNNKFPIVKEIADPNDTTNTRVIRDTLGFIPIIDSLFSKRRSFKIEEMKFVPIPKEFFNDETFDLQAGTIPRGGLPLNVFECKVPYEVILKGLDKQLIINLKKKTVEMNKYPGLQLGSMTEASTEGNWK